VTRLSAARLAVNFHTTTLAPNGDGLLAIRWCASFRLRSATMIITDDEANDLKTWVIQKLEDM
jgi:hypothetical protein